MPSKTTIIWLCNDLVVKFLKNKLAKLMSSDTEKIAQSLILTPATLQISKKRFLNIKEITH